MALESEAQKLSKRALARLISKSMRGDAEAFAEVYRIFINTIYFNVSTTLTDKSETEDAVQQVVLSLHRGLPQLKSPYAFHSYLYRITMNVCNKYNKKEAKQRYSTLEEVEEELSDESTNTPSEEFEIKERDELVRMFIGRLPEKQRYTLVLYYYYNLSYKSIAEAMNTSVTVVGSNINRAKKNMKQMLEEHEKRARSTAEGDETFQGASLDSVFAAGVTIAVNSALEPSAAELLWQKCVELAPEITVGVAVAKIKLATLTAVVAGIAAACIVVGAGVMMIQQANISQQSGSQGTTSTTHQTWFIPEYVSIDYESRSASDPETYNPIHAEITLSEGTPLEWRIIDAQETLLARGTGSTIEQTVFDSLRAGVYRAEWTIENDVGNSGVAYRLFTIKEQADSSL